MYSFTYGSVPKNMILIKSDSEKERNKAFWQAYKDGKFPENVIVQVDNAEDVPEGTLCYIRSTGIFNLPDREMTDEEILEIIVRLTLWMEIFCILIRMNPYRKNKHLMLEI